MGKCATCGDDIADETTFCSEHVFNPGTETKSYESGWGGDVGSTRTESDPTTGGSGGGGGSASAESDPETGGSGGGGG